MLTDIRRSSEGVSPGILYYKEVNVTATELSTLGSLGKILLGVPSNSEYYDVTKGILEFTPGATPYTLTAGDLFLFTQGPTYASCDAVAMLSAPIGNPSLYQFNGLHGGSIDTVVNIALNGYAAAPQESVSLFLTNDPLVGGDGTLKIKLWYYIRTFG